MNTLPDNVEMVIFLQDQLDSLVTQLKTVIDTLVELSDSHEEVLLYDELYFELHFDKLSNLSAKFQHTLVEIL